MSVRLTLATSRRVATQLRHDPRTIVFLLAVPSLLLVLLRYVFDSADVFAVLAPALLGVFPFVSMFLVTSITTLRERTTGTLERLMTTPIGKLDLLAGYAVAFGAIAVVQVVIAVFVSVGLGLQMGGTLAWILLVAAMDALLGVALGLFASAFARTEFQAIQFMPLVVFPQLLLCGLFHPRSEMTPVLRWVSDVMPVSYAVEALQTVAREGRVTGDYARDLVVVACCVVAALGLAAATLRRQAS
jgi:ABC-2 type transport system permease protein